METGHTMSSADSVHKDIETACKLRSIFTPECWYKAIEEARVHGELYRVVRMAGEFIDAHAFVILTWSGMASESIGSWWER